MTTNISSYLSGANGTTGYSSIPSNYDEFVAAKDAQSSFARRSYDPKPMEFPTIEERYIDPEILEDWRHQALPGTTVGPTFAVRDDADKRDWSLMPWEAVEEINKVLEFGAKKYSSQNWRNGSGFSWTRVLSSLMRHTFAWARGEDLDKESGLSHLAHMGCNVLFLIYYNKYNARYNKDDRVVL